MMKLGIILSCFLFTSTSFAVDFLGHDVKNKLDVDSIADYETYKTFGTQKDQIVMMSEMIALLFAYQGIISFEDVGIAGVTNKSQADSYILSLYTTLWAQRNALKVEKKRVIEKNDLK